MNDNKCSGCGATLIKENAWMEDGCLCNSPKGCNDGNQTISLWRQEEIQSLRHVVMELKNQLTVECLKDHWERFWRRFWMSVITFIALLIAMYQIAYFCIWLVKP